MGIVFVMKLVLIYSVLNSVSIFCCSSMQLNQQKHEGNEADRLALLAMKAHIQHDPNQVTSSWNESLHFCLWYGVTCSQRHQRRVIKLELGSLALVGSISPHIGNLSFLRVLDLQNNSFTYRIPSQIGHLHRLHVLLLNNNTLSGSIPPNISNCFKLTNLSLSVNNLVGKIPSEFSSLSQLQNCGLRNNNLSGVIPPFFGNLSSLRKFSVNENNLEGSIPNSICQLEKLILFYVGVNRLSDSIPSCIYNLSSLVVFDISDNQIQGSLPFTTALTNLQYFSVYHNQLTGIIPRSISNATNLVQLQFGSNKLTGSVPNLQNLHNLRVFTIGTNNLGSGKQGDLSFVSELINATQLRALEFTYNNFGGTLPSSIFNLSTELQMLSLEGNQLHGSLSTGLGNLFNLQFLAIGENFFTGSIPNAIGMLSNLGRLYIPNSQFSGSIPSSLGNLTLLTMLQLQENNLEGNIPSSLGNCHSLLELRLSGNNLNGTIPHQVFTLSSLSTVLALEKNRFTGPLPMEIGKLKNLRELEISGNLLAGELPSSLGSCQSLEVLHLQGNFFNGLIPSSLENLRGLRDLDLSHNNFSGDIPPFLQSLKLQKLNLSFNHFWGAVPPGGVFKNASATSVAGNVGLCGGTVDLQLPACKFNESKGGGLSRGMKLMISLVSGFTFLGLAVLLSLFHLDKKKGETNSSITGISALQVSYATLLKATDGFSSTNLIGVGGFGSVYKGVLADDGVIVAVKVLNMLHQRASKSFMAECEALKNIRHRNLVKILTACSSIDFNGNDFKALVYEFMENGSLEESLHPSTGNEDLTQPPRVLSLIQRLNIAIDVASALDYLHNHCETPIVHCDLKPSNVLLDGDLTGHVSDFGLS